VIAANLPMDEITGLKEMFHSMDKDGRCAHLLCKALKCAVEFMCMCIVQVYLWCISGLQVEQLCCACETECGELHDSWHWRLWHACSGRPALPTCS
jgi:hypothetical protein